MTDNAFMTFLDGHDDRAWAEVVSGLLPSIHEVDRAATRVWFGFYPLVLARALAQTKDPERLARRLQLQGAYRLADQIDTSHDFLYGHRYWPAVKKAVEALGASGSGGPLDTRIREAAQAAATESKADVALVLGITAAGVMTLQQVGLDAFRAAPGRVAIDPRTAALSPERVLAGRRKAPKKGLFGLLRTVDARFTVRFDESSPAGTFEALNGQDLAMAGASDRRDYASKDPRRVEGPIPVECRTAACGTCWIGVLAGAERLSDVDDREWRKMKEFGYLDTDDPKPLLRLACRAKAHGNVTIVVPPWNGVFGKLVEGKLEIDEEPAATEA
jgi:ferredoxin